MGNNKEKKINLLFYKRKTLETTKWQPWTTQEVTYDTIKNFKLDD